MPHDDAAAAAERARLGGAFTSGETEYARLRPGYPVDLVAWLVGPPAAAPVADIGAGTGKLTGVLVGLGHRVVAVDPSAQMLTRLRAEFPEATPLQGTGEATGLGERSVAAACYGQSWHWVDPAAGTAEADRILIDGGAMGLIWNFLDERDPRVAALEDAMHALHDGPGEQDESYARVGDPFVVDGRRETSWSVPMTTADVAALVTTRSYYLARPETERAVLRRCVADAVKRHFGAGGERIVDLPYRTVAYRYRRG